MRREWIHAGLLLAPALVLLFAFTHLPAVQTVIDSFFSTARGRRPSVFVGLANYERLLADATFMRAMVNNAIYAAITIPVSIGLALAMALFVHRHIAGRAFLRMAYFTPTVLPLIAVANIWLFFFPARIRPVRTAEGADRPEPAQTGWDRPTAHSMP